MMAGPVKFLRLSTLAVLGLLAGLTVQQDSNDSVQFLFPTAGLTFYYMDTVIAIYKSSYSDPLLYTFCNTNSGGVTQKKVDHVNSDNSTALVQLDFQDPNAPSCWFNLRPNTSNDLGANSETFTYVPTSRGAQATSTTTSFPGPSASGGPGTATNGFGGGAGGPTPSSSENSNNNNDLSIGAQAGIGVGAVMGGVGLAVLLAAVFLHRRTQQRRLHKKNNNNNDNGASSAGASTFPPSSSRLAPPPNYAEACPERAGTAAGPFEMQHTPVERQELDSVPVMPELPADFGSGRISRFSDRKF